MIVLVIFFTKWHHSNDHRNLMKSRGTSMIDKVSNRITVDLKMKWLSIRCNCKLIHTRINKHLCTRPFKTCQEYLYPRVKPMCNCLIIQFPVRDCQSRCTLIWRRLFSRRFMSCWKRKNIPYDEFPLNCVKTASLIKYNLKYSRKINIKSYVLSMEH